MASKIIFVVVVLGMAFVVGILACFGWMHGHAWWRRKEHYGSP